MAQWVRVLASWFPQGGGGACGGLNDGHFHYAELGTATLQGQATGYGRLAEVLLGHGELPCGYGLWVRYKGRATYATKEDRGYGNPGLSIHDPKQRRIDLYYNLANYLHFSGVDYVEVTNGKHPTPPPIHIGTGQEPPVSDYDPSPYLIDGSDQMGIHGRRAYDHARFIELYTASVKWCDVTGPH